jgi:hypothetical protein
MTADPSRTDRYIARVKEHLLTLSNDEARRVFLNTQVDSWEERYRQFRTGEGTPTPGATAFDYVETIAALGALRTTYERKAA